TCGSDPRTSGWRFAEPPCPGAACQPASPAATATRSSSHPVVKHPEQLCASERCHLIDAEILPSTRKTHPLEKPLHISTPTGDRYLAGWGAGPGGGRGRPPSIMALCEQPKIRRWR